MIQKKQQRQRLSGGWTVCSEKRKKSVVVGLREQPWENGQDGVRQQGRGGQLGSIQVMTSLSFSPRAMESH